MAQSASECTQLGLIVRTAQLSWASEKSDADKSSSQSKTVLPAIFNCSEQHAIEPLPLQWVGLARVVFGNQTLVPGWFSNPSGLVPSDFLRMRTLL